MKRLIKSVLALILTLSMVISSLVVVAADTITDKGDDETSLFTNDDGNRAYELVWKFKSDNGHMWKRRWNMTLGCWYDPEWILVY